MSEETEPVKPEPFPKPLPKREAGNTAEIENIEPETSPCSVPAAHIRSYEQCCDKYARGEMSDLDVLGEVIGTLKKLRSADK